MLFDDKVCVAFKNIDGQYISNDFSVFELNDISQNFTWVRFKMDSKNICISLQCPICGEKHIYRYKICDFVRTEVIIGGCENFGTPVFYIGNKEKVRLHVKRYNDASLLTKSITNS